VSKGQVLLKLDDASQRQSLIAAQQQVAGVAAQLEQAKTIFERQQNLWKENIGTELQVLNAKTSLESLQSQYKAARANMEIAEEQVNNTAVRAGISGTVNTMNIKVGEFFTAGTQVQIVNNDDLKVTVNVPENYSGKIKVGSLLQVSLPDLGGKELTTTVNVVGKLIDPISRTFYIEGKVPQDQVLRSNQVAVARIKDYADPKAIVIPVNTIQNDEKGKYVMVATGQGDKMAAKKRYVTIGQMYHDKLQVTSGLEAGDTIISEGYQSLYDGQPIMVGL
jgi:RND family efflux transporter MFP subunit